MNRYTSLQPVVVLWSAVLFLSACTTPAVPSATPIPPTATPITQAGSRILHNNTWGFGSSVTFDRFTQDASGELVAITGDISIDFALLDPPSMKLVEREGQRYFLFNTSMPRGGSAGKVIFTTSEAENGDAQIPRFTPTLRTKGSVSYVTGNQFRDYKGSYEFRIGLAIQGYAIFAVDSDVFYNGSEHHIYGEVQLFGVKFENNSKEPLVFKITDGKYVYVEGIGTATTPDGDTAQFGK